MIQHYLGPQRSCIVCRTKLPAHELLRFVCSPDAELVLDYRHKLPGRGAYTCCKPSCYAKALDTHAFARAFKRPCKPASIHVIVQQLRTQVLAKVVSLLGMARKSGIAVSGQQAILHALRRPREVAWVLIADDMAPAAAEKFQRQVHEISVMRGIDKQILTQALGSGERSAVLLKKSPLAQALKRELQRYVDVMGEV
ncbi:MAG: DUF448 domain-containing protein [Geobacteraceae bacterium]|nr:DUF448 domain-containing protein [Geobacteraceae bacterium]